MPMKLRFNPTLHAASMSLTIILGAREVRAVVTYDLKTDWSDVSNPNGVWSYNEGSNALPHVAAWDPTEEGGTQPAWAVSGDGSTMEFDPVWFKSVLNEPFSHDWQVGDVVVHTTDANGIGHGPADVTWTSPLKGTVDIAGGVWMGRDIFRGNHWTLSLNGTPLSGGDIFSGDPYDRASPYNFAAGSGGASVLSDVPVNIGDIITLQIMKTFEQGDFVGVNLTVAAIPEPSSIALCFVAATGLSIGLRRKVSRCPVN
jgi:hypothetical protein